MVSVFVEPHSIGCNCLLKIRRISIVESRHESFYHVCDRTCRYRIRSEYVRPASTRLTGCRADHHCNHSNYKNRSLHNTPSRFWMKQPTKDTTCGGCPGIAAFI